MASGPPINSGLLAATKEGGKGKRAYSTQASKKDSSIKNQKLDSKTCTSTVGEEKGGPTGGVGDKRVMQLLLAHKFQLEGKKSPIGYWISEKCMITLTLLLSSPLLSYFSEDLLGTDEWISGWSKSVLGWRGEDLVTHWREIRCSSLVHLSYVPPQYGEVAES